MLVLGGLRVLFVSLLFCCLVFDCCLVVFVLMCFDLLLCVCGFGLLAGDCFAGVKVILPAFMLTFGLILLDALIY